MSAPGPSALLPEVVRIMAWNNIFEVAKLWQVSSVYNEAVKDRMQYLNNIYKSGRATLALTEVIKKYKIKDFRWINFQLYHETGCWVHN